MGFGLTEIIALCSAAISIAALILSVIAVVKSSAVKKFAGVYDDYGYDDDYSWSLDDIDDFDVYLNEDDDKKSEPGTEKELKF
jgi:hypothetical protein